MTSDDRDLKLTSVENARALLSQWSDSLAQVLESMTDQRPRIEWQGASGSFAEVAVGNALGPPDEILWWEQPFQPPAGMTVWVGAPRTTWEYAGTLTLKAAGLETVESAEARNTWFEIVGQSLSTLSRSLGSILGGEVTRENGAEHSPEPELQEWASVSLKFKGEESLPALLVAFNSKLLGIIAEPPKAAETFPAPAQKNVANSTDAAPLNSRTMELLLDVDLPVSISFGKAQLPMKDVLKLTTGSIVELNRGVNEQVEVLVNQCLIARGEVVVVDGNYGVRIQEIASRMDRIRTLR